MAGDYRNPVIVREQGGVYWAEDDRPVHGESADVPQPEAQEAFSDTTRPIAGIDLWGLGMNDASSDVVKRLKMEPDDE